MKFKYVLPASLALVLPILFSGCTSQTPQAVQSTQAAIPTNLASASVTPTAAATPSAKPSVAKTATPKATVKATPKATPKKTATVKVSAAKSTALKQLKTIVVAEANYNVKYARTADFGTAWYDYDHNGCDTRNDILKRDLTNIVYRSDDPGCTVASGTLHDPYTGRAISFTRGEKTSLAVQIDHIFPLALAFRHGAASWSPELRLQYANDQKTVLLAVDGPSNGQKSASGPADWMPSNYGYRCTYVEKFTNVASVYKLTLSRRDAAKIKSVLETCS